MAELAEKYLGEIMNGTFTSRELLIAGGAVLLAVLLAVWVIKKIAERSHIKKTSIFRVKKNKYKSRLGKKNIKY